MKTRNLPRIQLDDKHLPYRWQQGLVSRQEIGGVMLLFLSGKTNKEIDFKVKEIKKFCKTLNSKIKPLAKVE